MMGSSPAIDMMNELARAKDAIRTIRGQLRTPSFNSERVAQQTADVMNFMLGLGSKYGASVPREIGDAKWGMIDKDYKQAALTVVEMYTDHFRKGLARQNAYEISLRLGGATNRIDRSMEALEDAVYGVGRSAKMVIAAAKAVGTPQVKVQSPLLAPARALFNKINFLEIDAQEWRDAQADMNRLDDMIGGSQLTPGEKGIIAGALQNCDIALRGGLAALKRGAGISRDRYKQMALSAVREIVNELQ